jgi:transcriptional regulator with XRE-family HTH domain
MREARLRAGLSQRELGLRIGRPAPQIARWERGVVDPGFALVQRVMRACGFDLDEQLVPWADEFRERLEENLRSSPAERFARALDRCAEAGLPGAPRRILGELEAAGVGYCLIGGLAASIRGAERLSVGADIAPGLGPENERRLDEALVSLGSKPISHRLLSKLEGVSDVKTPAGLLRVAVQPRGTLGFDRDLRRVSGREHLGPGRTRNALCSLTATPDTSADVEERPERAADQVALRRVLVCCSFRKCPSELRVESDGHDLGWAVAEAWPASAAQFVDVVAAFGLLDERVDQLVGDRNVVAGGGSIRCHWAGAGGRGTWGAWASRGSRADERRRVLGRRARAVACAVGAEEQCSARFVVNVFEGVTRERVRSGVDDVLVRDAVLASRAVKFHTVRV